MAELHALTVWFAAQIKMLASARSAGKKVTFMGQEHTVEEMTKDSFKGVDIALFSAGGSQSKAFAPTAVESGCIVVDNSSAFRMDPNAPLVVPEVNPHDLKKHKGIIANPNCSTILMNVVVWPLHKVSSSDARRPAPPFLCRGSHWRACAGCRREAHCVQHVPGLQRRRRCRHGGAGAAGSRLGARSCARAPALPSPAADADADARV